MTGPGDQHAEDIGFLKAEVQTTKEDMKDVKDAVARIERELTKYKGFIGGITFVWSCLVAFFTLWKTVHGK